MKQNFRFFFSKLSNKLWFRPLLFCLLSVGAVLVAHLSDDSFLSDLTPKIESDSLDDLLTTISASMLVIAIFAVGSMLSAFSAASGSATPRSFSLIVADDVSQNALSVYIGSFIFSIVGSIALKNGYYGEAGIFTLFVLTLVVFAIVILTFLKWVERISKLGRLGHTIKKVEEATEKAIAQRLKEPFMGGVAITKIKETDTPVFSEKIGYVQHINMDRLQEFATDNEANIFVNCIPGKFVSSDKPLAYIKFSTGGSREIDKESLIKAFEIDDSRSFHDDPRFGLIALSEIASRALSPGINDPGTAIAIIGSHVRLFTLLARDTTAETARKVIYDKVFVPIISLADMFDDAFRPIARDGAGNLEVMLRLQKALISISQFDNKEVKALTATHSKQAFERAELAMDYTLDLELLKKECLFNRN